MSATPLIDLHKFKVSGKRDKPLMALVACGSFSPVTDLHLRIFEAARNQLQFSEERYEIIGGLLSPVHDGYQKPGLVSSEHRISMCEKALESSDWISVARWEAGQPKWSETVQVLRAYSRAINEAFREHGPVTVRLLCGADILTSIMNAKLWPRRSEMLQEFGLVCLNRVGFDAARIIWDNDIFHNNRSRIALVDMHISNNISSTGIRQLLSRGHSVTYLVPDAVQRYIYEHDLYGASQGLATRAATEKASIRSRL